VGAADTLPPPQPLDTATADHRDAATPAVIDQIAVARLYGEPLFRLPQDLYIPPEALEIFLEAFEGPLDLLLYLIRRQNFNILDIPLASVTRQYLDYVDQIRRRNLELASEYLLMAAMLIEIKSRMLLPPKKTDDGSEPEDPRVDLVRRLVEYEQIKLAAARLDALPLAGRDFLRAQIHIEQSLVPRLPDVNADDLRINFSIGVDRTTQIGRASCRERVFQPV
jgi:segregation and condensation protein A